MWQDTTSYSRDRERVPTCWTAKLADLRITVTKGHIYHPGKWVMHCEPWFNAQEIADDSCPTESAQRIALDAVRKKIQAINDALNSALAS